MCRLCCCHMCAGALQCLQPTSSLHRLDIQRAALPSDYPGSRVVSVGLPQMQALQRRSFGHRNLSTYIVVVADADSPACVAVESPIEALASGLAHERAFAVMHLDVRDRAAAQFASRILHVGTLPAVLVYPEGAPGFLAYKGDPHTCLWACVLLTRLQTGFAPHGLRRARKLAHSPNRHVHAPATTHCLHQRRNRHDSRRAAARHQRSARSRDAGR